MTVKVDICNSTLIKLGAERINSLDDDNKRARLCAEQYPKILKRVLRSHPWKFALKRAVLPKVDYTPEFGTENFFQLPADCIRVIGVMQPHNSSEISSYPWKIEGRLVVTEVDTVNLKYVSKNTEEAFFDEDFQEALATALAHDICFALNQSTTQKQELFQEYEFWIAQARSHGAMEMTVDSIGFDEWTDSRL